MDITPASASASSVQRVHVLNADDWTSSSGTDYWAFFGDPNYVDTGSRDLVASGWFSSGFSHSNSGGFNDFLSSNGQSGGLFFDAAGDYLISPAIFGDKRHASIASNILGETVTTLNFEAYVFFSANNDEEETGI